ncbi:glycosyltransferase [Salinisphaera sp. LB1]|uniref:glycosyltransferase n=1 Tax=Salinisphaera sp. LB1 TaxID=2183911 RepID=UPI000D70723E|nr:glycosyltransferase [Salinisphaera sp. LB1]AWN14293.1 TPR/glycosyl transferase domain protein [Salinisphaera sp. LB1]
MDNGDDSARERRVLLVTFHYPPLAAAPGALRASAFARYLPAFGWQPHILAPRTSAYDPGSCEAGAVVPGHVHRAWAIDARRHLGWRRRYMAWTAVPDRWVAWLPGAIASGLAAIWRHDIQVIWSTYPIATSHLVAAVLARLTGRPWVAEFRDPMTLDGAPAQRRVLAAIERRVMQQADHLIFATDGSARDYVRRYPAIESRCTVIPNGYDPELQPDMSASPEAGEASAAAGPRRIVHSGQLYSRDRDPAVLFEALAGMKQAGRISSEQVRFVFRNTQDATLYAREVARLGLEDLVEIAPRLPHAAALAEQARADALLLLQGQGFNRQVPAKLFEYLRAGRPLLALVDPDGDTRALLEEVGVGECVAAPDRPEAIAAAVSALIECLDRYGSDHPRWRPAPDRLSKYSRRVGTARLAELLRELAPEGDRMCHKGEDN